MSMHSARLFYFTFLYKHVLDYIPLAHSPISKLCFCLVKTIIIVAFAKTSWNNEKKASFRESLNGAETWLRCF